MKRSPRPPSAPRPLLVSIVGKILWIAGAFGALQCLRYFLASAGIQALGGGSALPGASLALLGAILLTTLLWRTFRLVFPSRWPK